MTLPNRDTLSAILLLVFTSAMLWSTFSIRDPGYGMMPPAAWPQAVLVALLVLCLVYFFRAVTGRMTAADIATPAVDAGGGIAGFLFAYRNPILCYAAYGIFLLTLDYLGALIGGVALVFTLLTILGGIAPRQILLHAVIAVISVGFMWSIFTFALRVFLPQGEIIRVF